MESNNPITWTAKRFRFVAPTSVLAMGGVRPQDAAATSLGSDTWSPPIT
jgi:hypothetical protein